MLLRLFIKGHVVDIKSHIMGKHRGSISLTWTFGLTSQASITLGEWPPNVCIVGYHYNSTIYIKTGHTFGRDNLQHFPHGILAYLIYSWFDICCMMWQWCFLMPYILFTQATCYIQQRRWVVHCVFMFSLGCWKFTTHIGQQYTSQTLRHKAYHRDNSLWRWNLREHRNFVPIYATRTIFMGAISLVLVKIFRHCA